MSINIIGGRPNIVTAKISFDFAGAGLNATNIDIIFEVTDFLRSWKPGRSTNPITGATAGNGYYIIPKIDLDLTTQFFPPFDIPNVLKLPAYLTLAALQSSTIGNGSLGAVTDDPDPTKNGTYRKFAGTWTKVDLTFDIAQFSDGDFAGFATTSTNPGTPTKNIYYFAGGAGIYTNFLSAPSTPITVSTAEGVVIFASNIATGFWVKKTYPFPTFQKTITSVSGTTPDQLGQIGVDANGQLYIAIALTGIMWRKLVRHSDAALMYEPWYGTTMGVVRLTTNSYKFIAGTSTYLLGSSTIQLEVTRSGKITTTSGSAIVTGVGTLFLTEAIAGQPLYNTALTLVGTVLSIQSDTQLTLTGNAAFVSSSFDYSQDYTFTHSANKVLCINTKAASSASGVYTKFSIGGVNNCLVEKTGAELVDPFLIPLAGYYNGVVFGYALGEYLRRDELIKTTSDQRAYGNLVFEPMGGGTLNIDFPTANSIRFKEKTYLIGKPNGHLLGLYSDTFPVTYTFTVGVGAMLVLDTTINPVIDGIQAGYDKHFIDTGSNCLSVVAFTAFDPSKHVVLAVYYPVNANGEGGILYGAGAIGRWLSTTDIAGLKIKNDYDRLIFSPYSGGVVNASFTGVRTITFTGPTYLHGKVNSKIIQLYSSAFPVSYTFLNDTITSQNLVFDRRAKFILNSVSNTGNSDYDQYSLNTTRTGTLTTLTSSKTVTAAGGLFLTELFIGEKIYAPGLVLLGTVASIESNTSLTLAANALAAVSGVAYTGLGAVYIETQEATNTDYHVILLHAHKGTIAAAGLLSSFWVNSKLNSNIASPYRINADNVNNAALVYTKDVVNNDCLMFVQGNDFHNFIGGVGRLENFVEMLTYGGEAAASLPIKYIMAAGDLNDGLQSTKAAFQSDMNAIKAAYAATNILTLMSIGNHDDNSYINLFAQVYTKADQRANYIDTITAKFPAAGIVTGSGSACYYFYDDTATKTRSIVLDPLDIPYVANGSALKYQGLFSYAFSNTQLNWLAGTALNLSSKTTDAANWHTLIFCHVPIRNTGLGEFMHPANIVPRIVNAFKNGGTVNEVFTDTVNAGDFSYNVSKNFATQNGSGLPFVGYFSGHRHKDSINVDSEFSDQTNIVVNNAWALRDYQPGGNINLDSKVNRTMGTITQNCFDLMIVEKNSRKVRALRFGAGQPTDADAVFLFQRSFTY